MLVYNHWDIFPFEQRLQHKAGDGQFGADEVSFIMKKKLWNSFECLPAFELDVSLHLVYIFRVLAQWELETAGASKPVIGPKARSPTNSTLAPTAYGKRCPANFYTFMYFRFMLIITIWSSIVEVIK